MIKRLVEEGAETHELYDTVKEFMLRLPQVADEQLKSAECLILLRILNQLGFLRADPDLVVCLEDSQISEKVLDVVSANQTKTISLINESLHAAEFKH